MPIARDPLADAADAIAADRRWFAVALALALGLHAALILYVPRFEAVRRSPTPAKISEVIDVDVDSERPKPPPPAVEPAAVHNEVKAPRKTWVAPARAAAVLTQTPDTTEPVDLTADGFVIGAESSYAGGHTSVSGANALPAQREATASAPTPPPPPDRSRPATILGGEQWSCPFPAEADEDRIDHAIVTIRVDVNAAGSVMTVTTVSDPGHGFAREAKRCATDKNWSAALDRTGAPIESKVTIRIRCDR
jgi:protein TonB